MRKLLKILLFLLLIPLTYLLLINLLPDEELSAGAKEWLQPEPETVSKEENSYYLLWGLDAPVGVDMREYGEAVVEGLISYGIEKPLYGEDMNELYLPEGYEHDKRIKAEGLSGLCSPVEGYCLNGLNTMAGELLLKGNNALLLKRYRKLGALNQYQTVDSYTLRYTWPNYSTLTNAQKLNHIAIASQFVKGERSRAIAELATDLQFTRMLLRGADSLIFKLIAMRLVGNSLHLYSQFLEESGAGGLAWIVSDIAPLSKEESNFSKVFIGELHFQQSAMSQIPEEISWEDNDLIDRLLYGSMPLRERHFINISQAYMEAMLVAHKKSPGQFEVEHKRVLDEYPDIWDTLYSPVNSVLLSIAKPMYSTYMLTSYDLNALIRLLKLKAELISNNVPVEKLDAFIAASPYAHAYPAEVSPIRWDPGAQALTYDSVRNPKERDLYTNIFFRVD